MNAIEYLKQHPDVMESIKKQVYDKYFSKEIIIPKEEFLEEPEED